MCQRVKQVSQNVNCVYSFIPAPFLLALFSPKLFYNNWRCEQTAGRGLPLEKFGVKTEELEQVCVFSFICFLMYFRSLISLSVKNSFIPFILPFSAFTFRGKIIYCPATAMQFRIPLSQPKTPEPKPGPATPKSPHPTLKYNLIIACNQNLH